ncbi:MAG TPA: hypothetical protein ENI73_06765, partial [Spirochaetes bacterium]|nr:hypothetical protein [Spirochaetota bacterium]
MRTNKTVIYNTKLGLTTILLFSLFIFTFCSGNTRSGLSYETHKLKDFTYYTDIRQWKVITPSQHKALAMADNSKYEWKVYLDNGIPRVSLRDEWEKQSKNVPTFNMEIRGFRFKSSEYCFLKVSDGWLVGYNAGEFGGGLVWFSKNGKKHYEIKFLRKRDGYGNDRIHQFETVNGKIYALAGLAHLFTNEGHILHLFKRKG